jgi:hypothetical protein
MGYYLTMKDFEGMHIPSGCGMGILLTATEVAAVKYEEEKSKQEKLIKEKALKKPMTNWVDSPKKLGFDGEKLMASTIQAQSTKNGLKRRRSSEEDVDFKIQKKSKNYNNEKPSMRSKKGPKRDDQDVPPLPNPPPDLPEEFKNRIKAVGGTEVVMVIQKHLTATDLRPGHCRVSLPFGKINRGFLREEERDLLAQQMTLEVPFYEPSRKVSKIMLRQWDMGKDSGKTSSTYVLKTHWKTVVQQNELRENDVVQVWSFRVGNSNEQKLCMALVVVIRARNLDRNGRDNEGASTSLGREKEVGFGGSKRSTGEDASTTQAVVEERIYGGSSRCGDSAGSTN